MIEKLGITPGPWYYGEYGHIVTGFGKTVCQTHEDEGFIFENEKHNGPLVAAAPEMLEALIEMCLDMEQYGDPWGSAEVIIEKATSKTWEEIKEKIT